MHKYNVNESENVLFLIPLSESRFYFISSDDYSLRPNVLHHKIDNFKKEKGYLARFDQIQFKSKRS